jgi:hypothetical protein
MSAKLHSPRYETATPNLDPNGVFSLPIFGGSFGLRRSHSELRGNSRMAPSSLDSKAVLAQGSKRSALHRRRRRATCERRGWNRGRVANRGSAGICLGTTSRGWSGGPSILRQGARVIHDTGRRRFREAWWPLAHQRAALPPPQSALGWPGDLRGLSLHNTIAAHIGPGQPHWSGLFLATAAK